MNRMTGVELIDFWPDGYIGHTDSNGVDVGKKFLINIMSNLAIARRSDIRIYSHFYKTERFENARKILDRMNRIIEQDPLKKRLKLHGHDMKQRGLSQDSLNIWYTSENLRPPLNEGFDLFLSHDIDQYDGRNVYLPFWATRLGSDLLSSELVQNSMTTERKSSALGRKGVCAVVSNPEPIRMAFIKEARKHFDVDVYGAFGLPVHDKDSVLRKYKFNICFENDEFPGYVTEKPFDAWMNGCIPIWRGIDGGIHLNDEATINVTKNGFSNSIERIHSILNNDSEYLKLSGLPILKRKYNYDNLRNLIQSAF